MKKPIAIFILALPVIGFAKPPCQTTDAYWTNCIGQKDGYLGEWKDGLRHGFGTQIGLFAEAETVTLDSVKYVGEWRNNRRHGRGTQTDGLNGKYVGEWKDDKRNGQGTYAWPDGSMKLAGEWKNHQVIGQVTITFWDGRKYVGGWNDPTVGKAGQFEFMREMITGGISLPTGGPKGYGTMTYPDGRVKSGQWPECCTFESDEEVAKRERNSAELRAIHGLGRGEKFIRVGDPEANIEDTKPFYDVYDAPKRAPNPTPSETVEGKCPDPPDWDLKVCWEENPIPRPR